MTCRGLCGVLALAAACSSPSAPSSTLSSFGLAVASDTAAFEYRTAPNDSVDVAWQEAFHVWATEALGVTVTRRIRYNKYQSRTHMGQLIGQYNTNAFANAELFEIHTIWPRDNHEVIHLYSSAWGRTVALWSEGLAVAYQTDAPAGDLVARWNRVALHDLARQLRAQGRLIPVADLLTTSDFRRFDANVTYPQSGSFVRHVLDICGLDGVRRLFAAGSPDLDAASVRAQFEAACGRSVADAEVAWLAMLDTR